MFLMFLILHSRSTLGILKVFFSSFLQALLQLSFYYQCPCYCKGYVCQQSKSFLCMTIYIQGLARNTLGLRLLYINFCCVRFSSIFFCHLNRLYSTYFRIFFPVVKENQVGVIQKFQIRIPESIVTQSEFLVRISPMYCGPIQL